MLKILINLSEESYRKLMSNFLLSRPSLKIVSCLLILVVGISTILFIFDLYNINFIILVIWWLLVILFFIFIPYFIFRRTKTIYCNTDFFHKEMSLEIDSEKISWITSRGSKKSTIKSMYEITTINCGIIFSFSPYHILPVSYDNFSQETWDQLITYLNVYKKNTILSKYFHKYKNLRGFHE